MLKHRLPRPTLIALASTAFLINRPAFPDEASLPPEPQRVNFVTSDDVRLTALYQTAQDIENPRPAILLLHGGNQSKMTWVEVCLFDALVEQDYHVLSIDIRGRGESETGDAHALRRNPGLAHRDIVAALDYLSKQPGVDPTKIALIGSSYGSNLTASWMMVNDEEYQIKTIVCLSATRATYRFLGAFDEKHPIRCSGLYIASDSETARYDAEATARDLVKDTRGKTKLKIYKGQIHAASILQHVEGSTQLVLDWLKQELL